MKHEMDTRCVKGDTWHRHYLPLRIRNIRETGALGYWTWGLVKIRVRSLAPCVSFAATLCMEPKEGTKAP